jgi:hypothetical protein
MPLLSTRIGPITKAGTISSWHAPNLLSFKGAVCHIGRQEAISLQKGDSRHNSLIALNLSDAGTLLQSGDYGNYPPFARVKIEGEETRP